jgi:hypothetical protein
MSVVDIGAARFKAAATSAKTEPRAALVEALRRIDEGEWRVDSVVILGIETAAVPEDDLDLMQAMHAGPASCTERLGMFVRAQRMMMRDMFGED